MRPRLLFGSFLLCLAAASLAPLMAQSPPSAEAAGQPMVLDSNLISDALPLFSREANSEEDWQPRRPSPDEHGPWFFVWLMALVALLTIARVQFTRDLREWWRALGNFNLAHQWQRNREYAWSGHSALLFLVFAGSLGTWVWLAVQWSDHGFPPAWPGVANDVPGLALFACVVAVLFIVFLRDAIRRLIGILFRAEDDLGFFGFHIILLNSVAGVMLLPFLFVMAYAPEGLANAALYATAISLVLLFIWRGFRGFQVGEGPFEKSRFGFVLYICTLEIAPIAVGAKLLISWFSAV